MRQAASHRNKGQPKNSHQKGQVRKWAAEEQPKTRSVQMTSNRPRNRWNAIGQNRFARPFTRAQLRSDRHRAASAANLSLPDAGVD